MDKDDYDYPIFTRISRAYDCKTRLDLGQKYMEERSDLAIQFERINEIFLHRGTYHRGVHTTAWAYKKIILDSDKQITNQYDELFNCIFNVIVKGPSN